MNTFMRNIINNNERRTNRIPNRRMSVRREFGFRNGYNQLIQPQPQPQIQNYSNTISENTTDVSNSPIYNQNSANELETLSTLQFQMFDVFININVNNLSSELRNNANPRRYFSEFSYEELNIRFFHSEILNHQNIGNEIEDVLNNINEREFQNILNDFHDDEMNNDSFHNDNNSLTNSTEIIGQINKNISHGKYVYYSSILKNHTCPILLSDFENDDIVSVFNLCNHAIHESMCEKYVKTFTKCPLCNNKLFEL
jgi:hypothetical protein